jgi:hypothetical protein
VGNAQTPVSFQDLSFFEKPGATWKIASNVRADLAKKNFLEITSGQGILANVIDKKNKGTDLYSTEKYGDIDLEVDYLMAAGSNSGIYLQGRYEIQLMDSWALTGTPRSGDNGGVYERWDESKPDGQKGFEGYAPRQNVSRAPGLWQHLKISFQAPRFDGSGKKIENAKILRVELNGVVIQEDIELYGPTRGAVGDEAAVGPLRIQGDHGAVAFRNLRITNFDKPRPVLSPLHYTVFKGRLTKEEQLEQLTAVTEGTIDLLAADMHNVENEFAILYEGSIKIEVPGEYHFNLSAPGGIGHMKVGDKIAIPTHEWGGEGTVLLSAGEVRFSIFYSKYYDWAQPVINLKISGPGVREYSANERAASFARAVDPIFVTTPSNTLLRSFMDLPDHGRIVHAVSVGSPSKIHYTYDMDNGTLVQVWRGEFLDATPMWHERGDGSSRPRGSVLRFGKPAPTVAKLSTSTTPWLPDTVGTRYRTKGYRLAANDDPTFLYQISGATIQDAITLLNGSQGFLRTLTIENANGNFYVRLAAADKIERLAEGLYEVGDKSYYLKFDDKALKPVIRASGDHQEMIVPLQNKLSYAIIF